MSLDYLRKSKVRQEAEQFCRRLYPAEPLHGSWVCASEPSRYVVRVFCGERPFTGNRPWGPWSRCAIIAVDKTTLATEELADGAPYRPVLR